MLLSRLFRNENGAHKAHWHLGKAAPWFYFFGVALGVPFLGAVIAPGTFKWVLAAMWFATTPVYFWLAAREIIAEVHFGGLLDTRQVNQQTNDPYIVWLGAIVAIVIWLLISIVSGWGFGWYGIVEWFIIAHAVLVGIFEKDTILPLNFEYLQATSGQRRVDQVR